MTRAITIDAPRMLLSVRSLSGVSMATRDRRLTVMGRYESSESLAVALSKAVEAGVDGILAALTPPLRAALAELPKPVPIYAVVPVLSEYDRVELEPGFEEAIAKGRGRAGASGNARASVSEVFRPALFYHGNLAQRLPVLIDLERSDIPNGELRGLVLDAWFTDLALAAGNRRLFEAWCRQVRRRRLAAGLETRNLGHLLARLDEWGIRPDLVVGPVNPSGLLMKPTPDELLVALARTEIPVVACELCAGGVDPLDVGARFARDHGATGLAPDIAEMDDIGVELRGLRETVAFRAV